MTTGEPSLDLEEFRRRLEARLAALVALNDGAADGRKAVHLDQTSVGRLSRVDAMQLQAMAQATERGRNMEMHRVQEALQRIEEGEFGCCLSCGEPIARRRLEAEPTAGTCIRCASGTS